MTIHNTSSTFNTIPISIVTPMFLGGADAAPELRPPSIKGALRFWYRALHPTHDLEKLLAQENSLFGGVGDHATKSRLIVRVAKNDLEASTESLPRQIVPFTKYINGQQRTFDINVLEYLCYGTYDYEKGKGNVFSRAYLKPNQQFKLRYTIRQASTDDEEQLHEVFQCLFTFGGLGSRSRNGFGAISSDDFQIEPKVLAKELQKKAKTLSSYTAASPDIQLFETKEFRTWDSALGELGKVYRACRSELEAKHYYDKRSYISAPIIVDKKQESFLDRHSKPYILNVIPTTQGFKGIILFMPYHYLADHKDFSPAEKKSHLIEYQNTTTAFNSLLSTKLSRVV